MKKIFITSLLLLFISAEYSFAAVNPVTCTNTVSSDTCNTIEGCYWTATNETGNGKCTPCDSGKYGAGCTNQCPDSHPTTVGNGAQQITECVYVCQETEITDENQNPIGKKIPTQDTIPYSNPDQVPSCEYKTICYGTETPGHTYPCTTYHLSKDETTCEPDYKTDSFNGPGNGGIDQCSIYFMQYENNRYTPTSCTVCSDNYHLAPTETNDMCGIYAGNKCDANSISCKDLGNPTGTKQCEDTSKKSYTWNADTQSYDYSECTKKCNVQEGWNTNEYTFSYDGKKWVRGDSTGTTQCNSGYCLMPDEKNCNVAADNWYAEDNNPHCVPCPAGTRTNKQGATSKYDCVITNATKFCDKTGCFTLPINDTITYF